MEDGQPRWLEWGREGLPSGNGERGFGTSSGRVSVTSAAASPLQGYTRIQEFRKPDGSYGAWLKRDSSTW